MRLAVLIELQRDARELCQAHREVVVGARIVGAPPLTAFLVPDAVVEAAAVEERAVEVSGLRPARRSSVSAAAHPDLLREGRRGRQQRQHRSRQHEGAVEPHALSMWNAAGPIKTLSGARVAPSRAIAPGAPASPPVPAATPVRGGEAGRSHPAGNPPGRGSPAPARRTPCASALRNDAPAGPPDSGRARAPARGRSRAIAPCRRRPAGHSAMGRPLILRSLSIVSTDSTAILIAGSNPSRPWKTMAPRPGEFAAVLRSNRSTSWTATRTSTACGGTGSRRLTARTETPCGRQMASASSAIAVNAAPRALNAAPSATENVTPMRSAGRGAGEASRRTDAAASMASDEVKTMARIVGA